MEFTVSLYGITFDYLSVYNLDNKSIIQCLTDESRIFIKNPKGELKKIVKLAISSIKLLPKGYSAVFFYKSSDKNEICVFDKEGVFQYIMGFPDDKSNIRFIFTSNGFARVETAEERDLYAEYQITNLPEIFNN